jgi:hypothetical protein
LHYLNRVVNPSVEIDGYEVDRKLKVIHLDTRSIFSTYSALDVAGFLKAALQVEIAKTHAGLLERVGWGTGKVVLGIIEGGIGLIGIIVPEPGTTAGGIVVFTLGANTVIDGFSQLSGANKGHGYILLPARAWAQSARASRRSLGVIRNGDARLEKVSL